MLSATDRGCGKVFSDMLFAVSKQSLSKISGIDQTDNHSHFGWVHGLNKPFLLFAGVETRDVHMHDGDVFIAR